MEDPREQREAILAERVDGLAAGLRGFAPHTLASRTATEFAESGESSGAFHFELWDRAVTLTYPDFRLEDIGGTELPVFEQAIVLYYFDTCDGTPRAGSWIAYSDLPDGRFYSRAFQGYTGSAIARAFGNDLEAFEKGAREAGGEKRFSMPDAPLGDSAFAFQALPMVTLLVTYWLGDEDFPSNSQVLFDAAVAHHFPTEGCAILGSTLTRRLLEHASHEGPAPGAPSPPGR